MKEPELTHAYCLGKAARTLESTYKNSLTTEVFDHTMAVIDRWLAIASEIRAAEEMDAAKYEAIRQQHLSQPS